MALAPPAMRMSLSPATSRACRSALSIPSLTKWNVVPPGRSQGLADLLGQDEDRRVEGGFLGPEALAAVEHPLAHDAHAGAVEGLLQDAVVLAGLAAVAELQVLAEELLLAHPLLELHPLAEPVLAVRVVGARSRGR